MYKILFYSSKALARDRKKLRKNERALIAIQQALGQLAVDPFKVIGIKKLVNSQEATYRMSCGEWRVLFDIDTGNRQILIYRLKQRKEGYK